MRAAIFTEGSSTTGESTKSYAEYFEGSFMSVNTTIDAILPYCNTEIHILSEDYGYVLGKSEVESEPSLHPEDETEYFVDSLLSNLDDLDIIILLFTTDVFMDIITPNWDKIVENTKEESIWCIGTSRSALNSIDLERLERNHPVLIYQRRGVARLGNETRKQLLEHIRIKADD